MGLPPVLQLNDFELLCRHCREGLPERVLREDTFNNTPTEGSTSTASDEQTTCCSICLADYQNSDALFTLPQCGHRFHQDCLAKHLMAGVERDCPLCRRKPLWKNVWEKESWIEAFVGYHKKELERLSACGVQLDAALAATNSSARGGEQQQLTDAKIKHDAQIIAGDSERRRLRLLAAHGDEDLLAVPATSDFLDAERHNFGHGADAGNEDDHLTAAQLAQLEDYNLGSG